MLVGAQRVFQIGQYIWRKAMFANIYIYGLSKEQFDRATLHAATDGQAVVLTADFTQSFPLLGTAGLL